MNCLTQTLGFTLAVIALSLAGCSSTNEFLSGNKVDYKSAGQLAPLEIPPELTSPTRDNRYVVPEGAKGPTTLSNYQAERKAAKPGASGILPAVDNMRIERSGSQRWLVVNDTADRLWPLVKEFWQENGFLLQSETPDAGVMETDWAENRAKIAQDGVKGLLGKMLDQVYSTPERDRFRTRLERAGDGSTEIYISHRGMIEVFVNEGRAQTMWQPRPADPDLEAEFLRRLMVRLGYQEDRAKEMVAATPQALRATLEKKTDGTDRLEVLEPFDRAWRRVGLALDRVGFTVEDRDRQKGLYFVRYADPEKEMGQKDQGVMSKLAFWRSNTPTKVSAEQYRVLMSQSGSNTEVQVLDKAGAADKSSTARRILTLLHEQLK